MQMALQIARPGVLSVVEVACPAATTFAQLGLGGAAWRCGETPVDPDAVLGQPPLLHGAVLSPAPTDPARSKCPADRPPPAAHLGITAGPDCGRTWPLPLGRHTVGRDPGNDIVVDDPAVSRHHGILEVTPDGVTLVMGTTTNGGPRRERVTIADPVWIGATQIALLVAGRRLSTVATGDGTVEVRTRAAGRQAPHPTTVTVADRPSTPEPPRIPWLPMLLPLPVSIGLAIFMSPYLLAFGLLGPLLLGGNAWSDRRAHRRRHALALAQHSTERAAAIAELEASARRERAWTEWAHPDPATVLVTAEQPGDRLWSRRPTDPEFLTVRLGSGTVPARSSAQLGTGRTRPSMLAQAPVTLSLNEIGLFTVHGGDAAGMVRSIIGQLAVLHAPARLRLVLVGPALEPHLPWWGFLPHAHAVATGPELETLLDGDEPDGSWTVVLALGPSAWPVGWNRDALFAAARDPSRRLCAVVLEGEEGAPPLDSTAVLSLRPDGSASLSGGQVTQLSPDAVGEWWAHRIATALAPLRDRSGTGHGIPARVTFGELVQSPESIVSQWDSGRPVRIPLGMGTAGPTLLDLDRDGPHILVAGTTGAGKSELLRTMVAALALGHSPAEVSMLLVDYKGGAAFGELSDLPHVAGLLTDLDEHEAERALLSLQAELRRRERLLKEAGVANATEYAAVPGCTPLARLVVLIDEFRVLADELPAFLDGMVRIAATGRSLGVHVVLATQRPAGVVSADIKANVNCRIALRVRDRADSQDVLEADDAVRLSAATPGRALLRSGSGPLVEVQSAILGGPSDLHPETMVTVAPVRWPRPLAQEGHPPSSGWPASTAALVDYIREAAAQRGSQPARRPWLPALPTLLDWSDFAGQVGSEAATVTPEEDPPQLCFGVADVPDQQRREVLRWDPAQVPRLAIIGTSRSGRTNALRALAHATTTLLSPPARETRDSSGLERPAAPHGARRPAYRLHCVTDGAGGFAELAAWPTVASMVPRGDLPTVRRFAARMLQDISARKAAMQSRGFASLAEWRSQSPADAPPYELVLVDGWDHLAAASERADHGESADLLGAMVREGESTGLLLAATGDRGLLLGRTSGLFGERLLMRLADPSDAALAGLRPTQLPRDHRPGRIVRAADAREAQIVWCPTDSDTPRHARTDRDGCPLGDARHGLFAWPAVTVTPVPARVSRADLRAAVAASGDHDLCGVVPVGLGGDGRDAIGFDLAGRDRLVLVCGPRGSGRTTALAAIADATQAGGRAVVHVVSPGPGAMRPPGSVATDDELVRAVEQASDPVVLVDDADRLTSPGLLAALAHLAQRADQAELTLVCAADPARLAGQFRGPLIDVARAGCGILLSPGPRDGDLLGVRLPRGTSSAGAGRGLLVRGGEIEPIQVADRQ
ncbi:MAG: FHA domain-containing protein [Micrococcales bacterium]|nr:FHA domain-containing protein [Micrococcales bacterium]